MKWKYLVLVLAVYCGATVVFGNNQEVEGDVLANRLDALEEQGGINTSQEKGTQADTAGPPPSSATGGGGGDGEAEGKGGGVHGGGGGGGEGGGGGGASAEELLRRLDRLERSYREAAAEHVDFDDMAGHSLLEMFGETAKYFLTTRVVKDTDADCRFSAARLRCEPVCACRWDYRIGGGVPPLAQNGGDLAIAFSAFLFERFFVEVEDEQAVHMRDCHHWVNILGGVLLMHLPAVVGLIRLCTTKEYEGDKVADHPFIQHLIFACSKTNIGVVQGEDGVLQVHAPTALDELFKMSQEIKERFAVENSMFLPVKTVEEVLPVDEQQKVMFDGRSMLTVLDCVSKATQANTYTTSLVRSEQQLLRDMIQQLLVQHQHSQQQIIQLTQQANQKNQLLEQLVKQNNFLISKLCHQQSTQVGIPCTPLLLPTGAPSAGNDEASRSIAPSPHEASHHISGQSDGQPRTIVRAPPPGRIPPKLGGLTLAECFRQFFTCDWPTLFDSQSPDKNDRKKTKSWNNNKSTIIKVISLLYLFLEKPLGPHPGFENTKAMTVWRTNLEQESNRAAVMARQLFDCRTDTVRALSNKLNRTHVDANNINLKSTLPKGPNPPDQIIQALWTREALIGSILKN